MDILVLKNNLDNFKKCTSNEFNDYIASFVVPGQVINGNDFLVFTLKGEVVGLILNDTCYIPNNHEIA